MTATRLGRGSHAANRGEPPPHHCVIPPGNELEEPALVGWLAITLGITTALAGAALVAWAMLWDRSRGRERCPRCWYDMAGVPGSRCPECGRSITRSAQLRRTRHRWGWAVAGFLGVTIGLGLMRYEAVSRHGWTRLLPAPAWRAVLPLIDPAPSPPTFAWVDERASGGSGSSTRWARLITAHRALTLLLHDEQARHQPESAEEEWERKQTLGLTLQVLADTGPEGGIALPAIRRLLEPGVNRAERWAAIKAVALLDRSERSYQELLAAADHEPLPMDRRIALMMLGNFHADRAEVPSVHYRAATVGDTNDEEWGNLQGFAMNGLRNLALERPESAATCAAYLKDLSTNHPDERMRSAASAYLESLQPPPTPDP